MSSKFRCNRYNWFGQKLLSLHQYVDIIKLRQESCSEYLTYIYGLALMKTSTRLDEVINSIQELNFEKNSQYFLVLCHCLLYLGNYDSVVALCRQVINKDSMSNRGTAMDSNQLIKEPRFWLIFGLSLEYQLQHSDALLAYRMATKLEFGCTNHHIKYALFCVRHKRDFKTPVQILSELSSKDQQYTYNLNYLLALMVSAHPVSTRTSSNRAIDLISSLETYSTSNRNPSAVYNKLAETVKLRLMNKISSLSPIGDEHRFCLDYLLAKGYIMINSIMQDQVVAASQADKLIESMRTSDSSCWTSASFWNNLGVCYLIKKRSIACLSCFIKALHLNPLDWRIFYNISIACIHIGLISRALIYLYAAKHYYISRLNSKSTNPKQVNPIITTLIANCYEKLGEIDEARRLYIELMHPQEGLSSALVITVVNYLIYLQRNPESDGNKQNIKLKLHLLDQLEQKWLQRDQNDQQFNKHILDLAVRLGEDGRAYAWTKYKEE